MDYLKPKQHYVDRYDLHTIKECLDWYWKLRNGMDKHRDKLRTKEPKTDFDHEVHKCCSYTVNVIKGERYRQKNEIIKKWMDRDENTQKIYDAATPHAEVFCDKCNGKTTVIHKNLHDSYEDNPKVSFMFECAKCNKRQIFYNDGSAWDFQRDKCPKCDVELKTKYEQDKSKDISTITDYCPKCDYKKVDETDFKKSRENRKIEREKDEALLKKYRDEFCLNDKNGPEYIRSMDRLVEFSKSLKAKEKKEKDPKFKKAMKLKKLKLNQLKELLNEKLELEKYVDLQFGKPEIGKYVVIDFTVNDPDEKRIEYDSEKQLKKLITTTLIKTNWRLMSDGISYRLGILSGRLKAYESDEDLMRISTNYN